MSSRDTGHSTRLNVAPGERDPSDGSADTPSVESPSFHDVVSSLFDLNDRDVETFRVVQRNPGARTEDIAATVERDRSNVNRSVTRLEEIGLVVRHRRVMEAGGYFYEHYAQPTETVEEHLTSAVEEWAGSAVDTIREREWTDDPSPFDDTSDRV
jgi:predicted transcriptional regulator